MRFHFAVVGIALVSVTLLAQAPVTPSFEVASVKQNRTARPATTLFPLGPGDAYASTGGRFRATNQPLILYVRFAYRLGVGDLLDLPKWFTTIDSTLRHEAMGIRGRIPRVETRAPSR